MTTRTLIDIWPFFGLTITTPRVTLTAPTDALIVDLVDKADDIHSPDWSPFAGSWSLEPAEKRATLIAQYHWDTRASLTPEKWSLPLAIIVDDEVVGVQGVAGTDFTKRRVAETGSWLGRAHQGTGIGTEARRAILFLIFEGLGAQRAETEAYESNHASRRVTEKLGYQPNGETIEVRGDDKAERSIQFRLERADWEKTRPDDITIDGLDPCLPLLGLGVPTGS